MVNFNKRDLTLDLSRPAGRGLLVPRGSNPSFDL
jgi:hypothetical protein